MLSLRLPHVLTSLRFLTELGRVQSSSRQSRGGRKGDDTIKNNREATGRLLGTFRDASCSNSFPHRNNPLARRNLSTLTPLSPPLPFSSLLS
ncbi:unnamed protein product [Nezara viridula]|uniref:Uncharacterized protein n=1 Tax=Nezara viridula TaxID=85310 RepID=A0A9P0MWY3_NEZVI|nr:unnamed protein product [Nezara viridula]